MPIGYRVLIDFFVFRYVDASSVSSFYSCSALSVANGWLRAFEHDEFNIFQFTLNPGVSILAFYERENGIQVFCQTNRTNTAVNLVFYVYGVLWYRVAAGSFDRVSFYTKDGPYGVFWNTVNDAIGIGTIKLSSWLFDTERHTPFEVALIGDYATPLGFDTVANMEFYYQNYQFNIDGLDFK